MATGTRLLPLIMATRCIYFNWDIKQIIADINKSYFEETLETNMQSSLKLIPFLVSVGIAYFTQGYDTRKFTKNTPDHNRPENNPYRGRVAGD